MFPERPPDKGNVGGPYPSSLATFSPVTLAGFFLTYVAPCEFSSSSTSTLNDMVSGDGRCLLRLRENGVKGFSTVIGGKISCDNVRRHPQNSNYSFGRVPFLLPEQAMLQSSTNMLHTVCAILSYSEGNTMEDTAKDAILPFLDQPKNRQR